jgi:hypothetical protein
MCRRGSTGSRSTGGWPNSFRTNGHTVFNGIREEEEFFFEKKNQKTLRIGACVATGADAGAKVFCFFFSKKKFFYDLNSWQQPSPQA